MKTTPLYRLLRVMLIFILLMLFLPIQAFSEDEYKGPLQVRIRYIGGFDAKLSGATLSWVDQIQIDDSRGEVYLLDNNRKRVVVTDLSGFFLYDFNYVLLGINSPVGIDIDPRDGDIYIAEGKRVAVLNYRGVYKNDIDMSKIPDKDKLTIQSFDFVRDDNNGEGFFYLGDNSNGRIIVIKQDGTFVREFAKRKGGGNFKGLKVFKDEISWLDTASFTVYRFNLDEKLLSKFGMLSSLLGGFSMPVNMAVDEVRRRIIVVDTNRAMVIVFDMKGNPLFEFGGPDVFSWPRSVAVNSQGHIYVADNTGVIRIFEAEVEGREAFTERPETPALESLPPVKKEKDEVAKIVEEEGRLLPLFFAVDSAKLKKTDLLILNKNAVWLKKNPDAKINVRGYADERGTDEHNLTLSKKRAKAVMDYFVKQGIDSKRLKFIGYGKELTTDKSETGFARSRRVDFLVVK